MHMSCPGCGVHGSYECFTSDAAARACFAAAQKLPAGFGPLLLDYLTLFRPAKRLLTWKRARKLMDELVPMIAAGEVQRDHRRHAVPVDAWRAGIENIMAQRERLTLPLKSHGYLLSIVIGEAPKLAAAAEAAGEELRRVASRQRSGSHSQAVAELAGEIAVRKRLKQPPMTDEERQRFMDARGAGE